MTKSRFTACSLALLSLSLGCEATHAAPTEEVEVAQATPALAQDLNPRVPGKLSVVFSAETVIDADVEDVWEVMTDFASYPDWNPWVRRAVGDLAPGSEVDVDVMMGKNKMNVKHLMLNSETGKRFCWKDWGWNATFVYGQRCRTLTVRADGQVHYKVDLLIDGAMSHIAALFYGPSLREGLDKETPALKARAELLAGP
jgi:uncharacterized protein YndB with AHSA1/START domain